MCCGAARGARYVTEECFKWAHQRKVFGKPLIEQPVVRAKFAEMFARVESGQAWLEQITYQVSAQILLLKSVPVILHPT